MNRATALALCISLAMAPAASRADDTYRLCGPSSMGFIRTGKTVSCVGGSLDWRKRQSAQPRPQQAPTPQPQSEPAVKAGENREVDDALNKADLSFQDGDKKNACGWVSSAITSDINNSGGTPSSKEQREQLKKYAQRCNLRY